MEFQHTRAWDNLFFETQTPMVITMKITEPSTPDQPPLWRLAFRAGFLLAGAFAVLGHGPLALLDAVAPILGLQPVSRLVACA